MNLLFRVFLSCILFGAEPALARISHKWARKCGSDIDSDWKNGRENIIHTDKASHRLFLDDSIDDTDFQQICEKCGLVPANPFVPKAISMVSLDGKTVLTNDGSNYKVHPEDREISMGWTKYTGQVIINYNKKKDEYPFTIINKSTGEFVRAEAMIFYDKIINP